jgi:hypothetical protein
MSTKTTFKRIALVTVAALGFGVLTSVAPASAVAGTYTGSSTLSTSSLTVVATGGDTSLIGRFYVDVASGDGTLTDSLPGLYATESIVVTTMTAPTNIVASAPTTGDLTFTALTLATNANTNFGTYGVSSATAFQIPSAGAAASYASNNNTYSASYTTGASNRYWIGVAGSANSMNAGEYTVRVRVVNAQNFLIDKTLKIKFVTSIADAGATLTLANTGALYKGETMGFTSTNKVTATLKDANGGRVILGKAAASTLNSIAPALTGNTVTSTPTVVDTLSVNDTGVAGTDHTAPTAAASSATLTAFSAAADGVYGVTKSTAIDTAAALDTVVRVRLTGTSTEATIVVPVYAQTTARDIYTDLTMSATGAIAYTSTAAVTTATAGDVTRSSVDSSTTYVLPTTTTSGTLTVNLNSSATSTDNVAGATVIVTPTWTAPFVSTAVTPATSTTGTSAVSDASGNIKLSFTNTSPLDGGQLTYVITGFASGAGTIGTGSRTVVIKWQAPVLTSLVVLDPLAGTIVKSAATTVFTVGAYDQFGNGLAGQALQPAISTSTHANYVLGKTYAPITTGVDGTATWTLTDAKPAIADDVDSVSFTSTAAATASITASRSITYATTLPVVATLTMYANSDMGAAATALLSSSGLGATTPLLIQTARNQSRDLNSFADHASTDDMVTFKATAVKSTGLDADGALCTVAASSGAHILSSTGLPLSSRNFVVTSGAISWNAIATTPGVKTYTVTCGTATATAKMTVDNAIGDARTVKLTGAATGTANGDGVPVTVTVTDRFGNGVAGVSLTLSASGAGSFSGGATTQSFTTDATGTYSFNATSLVGAGGVGTFSVSAATGASASQFTSLAGYAGATVIDSTVAAGNSTGSLAITFAAGDSAVSVAAQAAADAAAEATDAANAATDAANAAAEAADAATAAAQDAADAVAALSAQVSSLISGLKSQLTALTNLVIKIQKKVKA